MLDINYLKMVKKQNNITNSKLAELSGVPLGTVNKILSGQVSCKVETYKKLSSALQFAPREISNGVCKVACCEIDVKVGSCQENANQICQKATYWANRGAKVIVFSEMVLTGATVKDLIFNRQTLLDINNALQYIKNYSQSVNALIFVGTPLLIQGALYNTAVCFFKGKILGVTPKTNLSVEDKRYFTLNTQNRQINLFGEQVLFGSFLYCSDQVAEFKIGVEISNDLFSVNPPSDKLCLQGANLIINLSSTPEIVSMQGLRENLVQTQSYRGTCAYVLCDCGSGESTTDYVWGGHKIIAENGKILVKTQLFSGKDLECDVDLQLMENKKIKKGVALQEGVCVPFSLGCFSNRIYSKTPFIPTDKKEFIARAEQILTMQAQGLVKRIKHTNCKTLVIGISGGLDSALAMLVCVRAFNGLNKNLKDIIAVTMPCFGTSDRTYQNAVGLTNGLGLTLKKVDIKKSVLSHFEDIGHSQEVHDVTYENAQARERTQVLMDIANKTGGLVVGTGDLSELALGWATYNGDHMSNYGVNGSVPKTLVKALVGYEAQRIGGVVKEHLIDIVDTPVSPELIPTEQGNIKQKTEDLVGPYILHDFFMYHFLSSGFSCQKIYDIACKTFADEFDKQTVYKWLKNFVRRFFAMQFKRSCLPDGVAVGNVGLSPRGGYNMASDAISKNWLEKIEKLQ